MKHDCSYKDPEDGFEYHPFRDAVMDGYIEYDDHFDAYMVSYQSINRWKTKKILGIYLPGRYRNCLDILKYCPYCGKKIYEEPKEIV